MKSTYVIISSFLLLAFVVCSSLTVTTDFDPSQDFSKYKTYRWATTKEVNPNDELAKNPLIRKRVVAAIDKALQSKGFAITESEPDFVVMIIGGTKEKMQVTNTGGVYGYGRYGGWYDPWWGPYGGSTHVSYYEEGSLVIDIVDWNQKELSWRGIGTGVVKEYSSQEEQQEALDKICAKILADFPPGGPQHQGK